MTVNLNPQELHNMTLELVGTVIQVPEGKRGSDGYVAEPVTYSDGDENSDPGGEA